jgi:phosphoesterase RecJ-like protein
LENTGNEIIRGISEAIRTNGGAIAIVPHSNPDGDAIGAAYALAMVLKNMGREVTIVTPNDYPAFLDWMSGEVGIVNYLKNRPYSKQKIKGASILFCVDFNEISRADDVRKAIRSFRGVKVLIDHHPNPAYFCDYHVSEPSYSSSSELVYDLLVALGLDSYMDKKAAEALYA